MLAVVPTDKLYWYMARAGGLTSWWLVAVAVFWGLMLSTRVTRGKATPAWLLLAFVVILASFLISSQVFYVALHSLGYRVGVLRLWATAIVAIVTSQLFPAGSVATANF